LGVVKIFDQLLLVSRLHSQDAVEIGGDASILIIGEPNHAANDIRQLVCRVGFNWESWKRGCLTGVELTTGGPEEAADVELGLSHRLSTRGFNGLGQIREKLVLH